MKTELGPILLAVLVSVGTVTPTLTAGFYTDDYVLLAALERPGEATAEAPFRLYRLAGGPYLDVARARGPLPWWTAPEFRAEPFRPLSSALFALDHAIAGLDARVYHLHSLLWLAAYVALGARSLVRRLRGRAAWLAALLFGLAPSQVFASGWISARHALVSAVFALLALELAEREGARARLGEVALIALALLAGESGVGAVLAIIAMHLANRRALREVVPHAILLGAYVVAYRAADLGFHGSGEYVDLRDPVGLVITLPRRILALVGAALAAAPSDLWLISPELQRGLAIAGLLALGMSALALRARGIDPVIRGALVRLACFALAVVPGSLGQLGDRVLLLPALGVAEVIALAATMPSPRLAAGIALATIHGLALAVVRGQLVFGLISASLAGSALARGAAFEAVDRESDVVVLAAADPLAGVFGGAARLLEPERERSFHVISMSPARHRFVRRDDRTLEWELDARIGASPRERVFRAAPIEPGLRVSTASFEIEVSEVSDERSRGVIRFRRRFADRELVLLAWTDEGLVRIDEAALDHGVTLPHVPGPQGL